MRDHRTAHVRAYRIVHDEERQLRHFVEDIRDVNRLTLPQHDDAEGEEIVSHSANVSVVGFHDRCIDAKRAVHHPLDL